MDKDLKRGMLLLVGMIAFLFVVKVYMYGV